MDKPRTKIAPVQRHPFPLVPIGVADRDLFAVQREHQISSLETLSPQTPDSGVAEALLTKATEAHRAEQTTCFDSAVARTRPDVPSRKWAQAVAGLAEGFEHVSGQLTGVGVYDAQGNLIDSNHWMQFSASRSGQATKARAVVG